jgi:hypothetical protein
MSVGNVTVPECRVNIGGVSRNCADIPITDPDADFIVINQAFCDKIVDGQLIPCVAEVVIKRTYSDPVILPVVVEGDGVPVNLYNHNNILNVYRGASVIEEKSTIQSFFPPMSKYETYSLVGKNLEVKTVVPELRINYVLTIAMITALVTAYILGYFLSIPVISLSIGTIGLVSIMDPFSAILVLSVVLHIAVMLTSGRGYIFIATAGILSGLATLLLGLEFERHVIADYIISSLMTHAALFWLFVFIVETYSIYRQSKKVEELVEGDHERYAY